MGYFPSKNTACKHFYMLFAIISSICLTNSTLNGQELKFGRINYTNYPEIECTFSFLNNKGEIDYSLRIKDFEITENTQNAEIIEVINPEGDIRPVSVVLMFDVSGSMKNERLALAKETAIDFIKQFPLETSEVAIASFSDQVYLNCDFTHNALRLTETINELATYSGTNYSKAFLNQQTGALDIVRNGRFKKAIVFLTDGLSSVSSEDVIKQASYEGITIYCITLALKMPQILKDIAIHTGGRYYEAVTNIYQLHNFYAAICQLLQTTGYSTIRWRAVNNCDIKRHIKLKCRNIPIEFSYEIPEYLLGSIITDPGILHFNKDTVNLSSISPISLTAKNQSFTITGISVSKKDFFSLPDSLKFPFTLKTDEPKKINIAYTNKDAGLITDKLEIKSLGCPTVYATLNGGSEEQLKLINPHGGEVFTVGLDTAVIWDGVKRSKRIEISYRTDDNKPWKIIGNANGLYSKWTIPNDTGSRVKVKIEPLFTYDKDFKLSNTLKSQSPLVDIYSNSDASLILITDKYGSLQLWDNTTQKFILNLGGFGIKHAILSPDSKRIIGFTGNEMYVWDILSLKLIARYTYHQKLYVSDIDPDGMETLLSTRIYKDIDNNAKAWSPGSNVLIPVPQTKGLVDISTNPNGLKAITINADNRLKIWQLNNNNEIANIKINPDIISVIISPTGDYFAVCGRKGVKIYNLHTGKECFELSNDIYKKFSRNGEILITADGFSSLNFWGLSSGKLLYNLKNPQFCKVSYVSNKILFFRNDTLTLKNLSGKSPDYSIFDRNLTDAIISPGDNLLLTVKTDNSIDFYDIAEGKKFNNINEFDAPVQKVKFSADGKTILVYTGKNELHVFNPYTSKKLKKSISGYFSIIAPKIITKDTISFKTQLAGTAKEKVIPGFITNIGACAAVVSGMEIKGGDTSCFKIISDYIPATIKENSQKEVEVSFNPLTTGTRKAILLTYTNTDTLKTVLIGEAINPKFEINPKIVDFGKVKVGNKKDSLVLILNNNSDVPIIIDKIENNGPNNKLFTINNTYNNYTIEGGQSLHVPITFKPANRGRVSGLLNIKIKEFEEVQNIFLYGQGEAPREVIITGRTLNSSDSLPIAASVICNDLITGTAIHKAATTDNGIYSFRLNSDRNYGIVAEKEHFLSGSENIDLSENVQTDTIWHDLYLTEIKSGAIIRMNCIFFEFAKWELLPLSKGELNRLVDMLTKYPKINIEIHGHTDSIGSEQSNLVLSKNRVRSVKDYLIKQGISASRVSELFFGETIPIATNATHEGRARNRRVEVKIK